MHIAIIPDGNRRWAKSKNMPGWQGHIEGGKRIWDIVKALSGSQVKYLTIWGSSYDNLVKRPKEEITALNRVYKETASRLLADKGIAEAGIRVRVIGEWESLLNKDTVSELKKLEEKTAHHNKYHLTALIGYNGDREMLDAVNKISAKRLKDITDQTIKENLWTHELPKVDLIVRTGGEPHLSAGFMMWDVRYSQLYFTEKLWPDFSPEDLKKAIEYYSSKERRLGA